MGSIDNNINVVMLPWLAHGHASPYLELAKRLTQKNNFFIHFCSTQIILNSIKKKLNQKQYPKIKLVEIKLPSLPELPPHHHTTNGLPTHLTPILKQALDMASPSFSLILQTLKPELVIYDYCMPWVPTIASSLNIRAVEFLTTGASFTSLAFHMIKSPDIKYPCRPIRSRYIPGYVFRGDKTAPEHRKEEAYVFTESLKRSSEIVLVKSFREMEGEYMDYFSVMTGKKFVPVGPLVESHENNGDDRSGDIMEWLDMKDEGSTVFVSFGSECFLTKEEIQGVAQGLELSNVDFLWAIRFPLGEEMNINEALPKGFLDRVGKRGKIVEGWAPQSKILAHSSVGGFVSHCGWSSIMESMELGKPIIALPLHLDQPYNAGLLVQVGVGVEVGRYENGEVKGDELAKSIRKVMVDEDSGDLRAKVSKFGEIMRLKEKEGIDEVVGELERLCKNGI